MYYRTGDISGQSSKKDFEKFRLGNLTYLVNLDNNSAPVQPTGHIGYFLEFSEQGATFKTNFNILGIIKLEK